MSDPMSDPFAGLEPTDGFHVVKLELGAEVSIHCQAYAGGELYNILDKLNPQNNTIEIASWPNASNADQGAATRLHLVLDAIARYFTTGGSWRQLDEALKKMERLITGGMYFEGYHYSDGYVTTEGTYQHVFVKDDGSGQAVLWEEPNYTAAGGLCGGFIDRTTLEQIKKDQEEDESAWGEEAGEEAQEPESSPHQIPLQHQPEHPPPGQPG